MNKRRIQTASPLSAGWRSFVLVEEEAQQRMGRYRETAETLRRLANAVRFDFRRREQLLALAAGFDRAAERIGALTPGDEGD